MDLVADLRLIDCGPLPEGVTIRRAVPADAGRVVDLDAGLRRHLEASPVFLRLGPQSPLEVHRRRLEDPAVATFVAERDGALVAFLRIGPCATDVAMIVRDAGTASVTAAFTRPEVRGSEVASHLLAAAVDWAHRAGLRALGRGPRVRERRGGPLLGPPRHPRRDLAEPPAGAWHGALSPPPPCPRPRPPAILRAMEIMGVTIRTIVNDNVAIRCDGCREVIPGTPWRVNLLDIVAPEVAVGWTESTPVNPGPHQFHSDPACVRRWMGEHGYRFCRRGEVREIMRPVALPTDPPSWGLCDGIHRDDHEFVPA